ncbi:MAG: PIN domain-containing protein [Candidatus Aenigmatarchaeota archaeon]
MIIDTNVLIFDTFIDSEKHEEAKELLDSLHEWYLPTIVLIEFIAFLNKSGIKREELLAKIEELIKNPKTILIGIESEDVIKAIEMIRKEKLSTLRLNDKIILNISKRLKKPLLTFDKDLELQAKRNSNK